MESKSVVILTLTFRKEGRYWVGECEELGTATDGQSFDNVRADLMKLVMLHLDGLEQIGEREAFFEERSIRLYTDRHPSQVDRCVPVSDDMETLIELRTIPIGNHLAKSAAG